MKLEDASHNRQTRNRKSFGEDDKAERDPDLRNHGYRYQGSISTASPDAVMLTVSQARRFPAEESPM